MRMFIPGRIEFLGKHTDYCGGQSLVCAIDRGFRAEVLPRDDARLVLIHRDTDEAVSIPLSEPGQKTAGHWSAYAAEVCERVVKNFGRIPLLGAEVRFTSDLPRAAGLSSSSALMIMVYSALACVNEISATEEYRANIRNELELAEYLGCIENGQSFRGLAGAAGVGTFGGSQDHAAIMLCRAGNLSRFSFRPLAASGEIPFPAGYDLVVASSGVAAEKTGAARELYNRVSLIAREAERHLGGRPLGTLIDEYGIDNLQKRLRIAELVHPVDDVIARITQFHAESFEIIPEVSRLLSEGKIDEIGGLIDRSQRNAETMLGNQVEETIYLQRTARELGASAASAFGAGFGGSVYALAASAEANDLMTKWRRTYIERFPQHAGQCSFFVTASSESSLG